ncbi:MAG: hypothetical protein IJ509_00095 [Bacilli bacterium]|nr:hypothetical protein [Bacilli bacterium]
MLVGYKLDGMKKFKYFKYISVKLEKKVDLKVRIYLSIEVMNAIIK